METQIGGNSVDLTDDGYMTDMGQWNKDVAAGIAEKEGITLGDEHWKVLEYLQTQYKNDVPLTIRSVGKSGVCSIKELYALFPEGPLKKSTKIAGIPKPVSCI
jgi:tRNA 2-thiouridine synthesizing protein E